MLHEFGAAGKFSRSNRLFAYSICSMLASSSRAVLDLSCRTSMISDHRSLTISQCMGNVPPLTEYMLSGRWKEELNRDNPLGMNGEIATTYAELVRIMWSGKYTCAVPRQFKVRIRRFDWERFVRRFLLGIVDCHYRKTKADCKMWMNKKWLKCLSISGCRRSL